MPPVPSEGNDILEAIYCDQRNKQADYPHNIYTRTHFMYEYYCLYSSTEEPYTSTYRRLTDCTLYSNTSIYRHTKRHDAETGSA